MNLIHEHKNAAQTKTITKMINERCVIYNSRPSSRQITEFAQDNSSDLLTARHHLAVATGGNLIKLSPFDGRLSAVLDALRIAAQADPALLARFRDNVDPGTYFCACVLSFERPNPLEWQPLFPRLSNDTLPDFSFALGWLRWTTAYNPLQWLLAQPAPLPRHAALVASAFHRRDPGQPLREALSDPHPRLRSRALRAVGEIGLPALVPSLRSALNDPDLDVRFSAAWSLARLAHDPAALAVLRTIVEMEPSYRHHNRAIEMTIRRSNPNELRHWHTSLARNPTTLRLAIAIAGQSGLPGLIPFLIEHLNGTATARFAGAALSLITGLNLDDSQFRRASRPGDYVETPNDDPADENVALDPDDGLPWPNPDAVTAWWKAHRSRFSPSERYICGLPLTRPNLLRILRYGTQLQRSAAALELAFLDPTKPLFEIRAPAFRQLRLLDELS